MTPNKTKITIKPSDLTRVIAQVTHERTGKWPWEAGSMCEEEITELIERALPAISKDAEPDPVIKLKPMKLTVVFVDSWTAQLDLEIHNQRTPFRKRTVQIELTQEQLRQLTRLPIGMNGSKVVYETIGEHWLEL